MLDKIRYLKYLVPVIGTALALAFITLVTTHQLQSYASDYAPNTDITAKARMQQLECLARNIYFESASEPFEGKVAVAQVTMNRVADPRWPDNVCAVVYQKNVFYERVVCQFSWYCNSPATLKIRSPEAYDESMAVAKQVLLEGFRLPSLNDAMFYHADYVSPGWRKPVITQIGRHIFYRG